MDEIDFTLPIGTKLKGKYEIKSHLASGGFAHTYLAMHGSLKEQVAIKEFFMRDINEREADGVTVSVSRRRNDDTKTFSMQLEKFKKEARRICRISNLHVVKVHDLFEENGTAYYVMDFVKGFDLRERLERRKQPYAEKTVINYLRQILDGLTAIHEVGLLHLDIKPQNIMLTQNGYIKLIDFGASKDYIVGAGATFFSSVALTMKYAPPEQMDGSYNKLGPWSDFYALGATLYKLLTLNDPPTYTMLYEDISKDKHIALPLPHVSARMKELVVWMMQTDRMKRPQKASDIVKILDSMKCHETRTNDFCDKDRNQDVEADSTIVVEPPQLSVAKKILRFATERNGKWQYVFVDTNQEWEVSCQSKWVAIKKLDNSFMVCVDKNPGQGERKSLIKITAGRLVKTIDIVQKGVQAIESPKLYKQEVNTDSTRVIEPPRRPRPQPPRPSEEEEFSPTGCLYLIGIVVIIALIIKYVFLT